jgi:hypothetical protein
MPSTINKREINIIPNGISLLFVMASNLQKCYQSSFNSLAVLKIKNYKVIFSMKEKREKKISLKNFTMIISI